MEIGWLGLIAIVLGSWIVLITLILIILATAFEEWKKSLPEPWNTMSVDELWDLYQAQQEGAKKAQEALKKAQGAGGKPKALNPFLPLHTDGGLPKTVR